MNELKCSREEKSIIPSADKTQTIGVHSSRLTINWDVFGFSVFLDPFPLACLIVHLEVCFDDLRYC